MTGKDHRERVYSTKPTEQLGWYKTHLQVSLDWIKKLHLAADAPIIDVGAGQSTLIDDLLQAGSQSITVLDISEKALCAVKSRLGKDAGRVTWLTGYNFRLVIHLRHFLPNKNRLTWVDSGRILDFLLNALSVAVALFRDRSWRTTNPSFFVDLTRTPGLYRLLHQIPRRNQGTRCGGY